MHVSCLSRVNGSQSRFVPSFGLHLRGVIATLSFGARSMYCIIPCIIIHHLLHVFVRFIKPNGTTQPSELERLPIRWPIVILLLLSGNDAAAKHSSQQIRGMH